MAGTPPLDRPNLYVVARLLERLWREEAPMLKTRLQVAANLNYEVFVRYLTWLEGHGLVTVANSPDGHQRIALSAKGHEAYRKLVQWVNEVVRGFLPGS